VVIPASSPVRDALRLSGAERPGEMARTIEDALFAIDRRSTAQT
jgi:hypothetical protein